jgi:hypothetical protein
MSAERKQKQAANNRSAVDAGITLCSRIAGFWPGTTDSGRSAKEQVQ